MFSSVCFIIKLQCIFICNLSSFCTKAYTTSGAVWLNCEKPGFSLQADVSIQQAPIKCKLKG